MRIKKKWAQLNIDGQVGWVPFFDGPDSLIGDGDFWYDVANDILHMKLLNISGQAYLTLSDTIIPTGTTATIDWNDGNFQILDLGSATGTVTLTFLNGMSAASYCLKIIQGATARNITWPGTVKWEGASAPTISTGNDDVDLASFVCDGTNYYASILQDLS